MANQTNKISSIIMTAKKITLSNLLKQLNVKQEVINAELKELCDEEHDFKWGLENNLYFIDYKKYFYGTLRVTEKGFGFAISANPDVLDAFVPPTALNNAINNDKVIYTIEKEEDGRFKAVVIEIITREKKTLIGTIQQNNEYLDFVPSESNFKNYRFRIVNKQDIKLVPETIVSAKIIRVDNRLMFVRVAKVIGTENKPSDRILSIAYEFGIEPDFEKKALDEANEIAKPINYQDPEVKRRHNVITNLNLVTIDGVDSKDLDDAIYVEELANKSFRLLVAIADVSHYVRPRTNLDNNAMNRGNSVYLVDKVIPMLPKILSDGVCSLNPNEEKLCMVCDMVFSPEGRIIKKTIYESIMISKARLNYKQVNEFFNSKQISESPATAQVLTDALKLHNLIEKLKEEKGVIDFDIDEPKIILDTEGNVKDIEVRERGVSERLIENFMVAANEAVATAIFDKELPFVYRNHDKPKGDDIIEWISNLKLLGINASLQSKTDAIVPKDLRKILDVISQTIINENERTILNISLLHHMAKAKYEGHNVGHFGLASQCYTHFTSPIRRYSDLMVHRYLKQYLVEKDLRDFRIESNEKFIAKACNIINVTEKQAVDAEREVIKVCSTEYMSHHIGEIYEGNIAAVLKFGLFIQIEKCIEGLVHISNLPDFAYDEKTRIMVNKNNVFYRTGQSVKIKVINADVKKRVIDFEIIN